MLFQPFEPSYSNHIGSCFHPIDGTVYMLVTWRLNGTGPFSLQIWKQPPPYTAQPTLTRTWKQGIDTNGPFGYGAPLCLPDGGIHISIPVGKNANQIEPSILIVPDVCAPFTPGAGPQGPQGEPGAGGVVLYDAPRMSDSWKGRAMARDEGLLVNIPALFNVAPAPAYLVRLAGTSGAGNVRIRMGTQAAPYFLTCCTQVAGIEVQTQGWVPGVGSWASTKDGAAAVWLQVIGFAQ